MRVIFAIFCWMLVLAIAVMAGWLVSGSWLVGLATWAIVMTLLVTPFLVSVPEVTGLITVNVLSGGLRSYGTGLHFRFPWEQVKKKNYLNLRLSTEKTIGESYPSLDGALMIVKWSFQYRPLLNRLDRYIAVSEQTIDEGLANVGGGILTAKIGQTNADDCKATHAQIELELKTSFGSMSPTPEELYGVEIVRTTLKDVDYEPAVQKTRASQANTERLLKITAAIRTDNPEISQKDAMNMALVINKDITKSVTEVEGKAGDALAALLVAMSQGGNK